MRGYQGLAERDYLTLDMRTVSGILPLGGTILRTSSFEPVRENAIERLQEAIDGDRLDAVLCLMQAAWASQRPGHGLPAGVDPLEGWIVSAEPAQGT